MNKFLKNRKFITSVMEHFFNRDNIMFKIPIYLSRGQFITDPIYEIFFIPF